MGTEISYANFLKALDSRLKSYFEMHSGYIYCKEGCSACCEKGDYPISEAELKYLMQGYIALENDKKILVQENMQSLEKGGKCPFLIDSKCSVYKYRPIICRVHGLAYFCKDKVAKVPYCVNLGLNYKDNYSKGELLAEPIGENLDTQEILKGYEFGEIRNLYEWLKP